MQVYRTLVPLLQCTNVNLMRPVGTDVAESRCDWMVDAVEGSPVAQDMAWWSPDSNTVRFIGTCGYHLRCTVATAYDALPVALPLPPSNFLMFT
eukprot:COSAG02_NODE_213_length_28704_cov_69.390177_15_plen_94_part_00